MDVAYAAIAALGTAATILGLAGLAILGPLVRMAQAHSRGRH